MQNPLRCINGTNFCAQNDIQTVAKSHQELHKFNKLFNKDSIYSVIFHENDGTLAAGD